MVPFIEEKLRKNVFIILIPICFFLLSPGLHSQDRNINARIEILYPESIELLKPDSMVTVKVCFDLLREEENYLLPFTYQFSLLCNGKKVTRETLPYEPPEGIAIKRTTICKTFRLFLEDFVKPRSPFASLKAHVLVKEADGTKIKGKSNSIELTFKSQYKELNVSGKVVCPTDFPLVIVDVNLFGMEPGKKIVPYGSYATTYTDEFGLFSTKLLSPTREGSQIIAHLSCPEDDFPSLTVSGNVSENGCSFGTIVLPCFSCGGSLTPGEIEQMLPPRSPAPR